MKSRYFKMTDAQRTIAREQSRVCANKRYARLKAIGLCTVCTVCGFEDINPTSGHSDKCRDCARARAESDTKRRDATKVPCVACGALRMPDNPTGLCRGCTARNRGEAMRKARPVCLCGQTITRRNRSGYCSPCNARRQMVNINARRAA